MIIITKADFVRTVAKNLDMKQKDVKAVLNEIEDTILDIISVDDSICLKFGTISGYTKAPWRVTGYYRILNKTEGRNGWTVAKAGTPKIKWSQEAKYYQPIDPFEYFERPENRYTTKARQFRKDQGLPELSEFDGMTEEEIVDFCERADELQVKDTLTEYELTAWRRHKRLNKKHTKTQREKAIEEDLQRQRDEGVPEDQLVVHTIDEINEMKQDEWREAVGLAREKYFKKPLKRDANYE